ncbi:YqcC family protein, partial [Pseudomonas aeruginosa]|nr:YqcC family protein [Pseudomonas aeruginosa]
MDRRVYALADQLLLIERELRALGWWSESRPAPEALASPEPFCVCLLYTSDAADDKARVDL